MTGAVILAAVWISAMSGQGEYRPAARLSREFTVERPLRKATLEATALGLYKPFVNGREITDRRLLPGWTQYDQRVLRQSFDVTPFLHAGTNTVSALLGRGWFCGMIASVGVPEGACGWLRYPMLWASLRLDYADGSSETVGTDRSWSSFYLDPALLDNDIYLGEEYDATFDDESWKLPGFRALPTLGGVTERTWPGEIVPEDGQPVRVMREIAPVRIERRPSGKILLDFGENLSGVERITLTGAHPGAVIVVRHGELLDADGDLWRRNLVFAKQQTTLTCGKSPLVYEPSFTFYGFRYAEVSGWPADEPFGTNSIVALKISSVGARTGSFSCSNELVNRFYANVLRSQEDNFVDVPTDCPQRCERFGWTGDAQVFCETALMNYDVRRFFRKWIADLVAGRTADGAFGLIAPYHTEMKPRKAGDGVGSAGWADAGVVCPWMLYRKTGDIETLRRCHDAIVKYVDLQDAAKRCATIGDHLNLDQPTSPDFVFEGLRIEMMRLAALVCRTVGDETGRTHFEERRAVRLGEFRRKHFAADGTLRERTQTAAAFAIAYDLAPDALAREKARNLLVDDIVGNRGTHLATGFLGTPVLLRALTEAGELDLAYRLLEQTTCPSWLYPVTKDATTTWERWDAIRPDGSFHPDWMSSLNHYAFGSAAAWLYDTVGGIRDLAEENPEWAGWRRFRLAPRPGGTLTHAEASLETRFGRISSAWKRKDAAIDWTFEVPTGTVAEVVFPGVAPSELPQGIVRQGGLFLAAPGRYGVSCEAGAARGK